MAIRFLDESPPVEEAPKPKSRIRFLDEPAAPEPIQPKVKFLDETPPPPSDPSLAPQYVDEYPGPVNPPEPSYDTKLSPQEELQFKGWKKKYAPRDSGADYDLRGAFKSGLTPNPDTGHWPDTFKKPNHPTFSVESQYAKDRPDLAGRWEGEKYIPAGTESDFSLPDMVSQAIQKMAPIKKLYETPAALTIPLTAPADVIKATSEAIPESAKTTLKYNPITAAAAYEASGFEKGMTAGYGHGFEDLIKNSPLANQNIDKNIAESFGSTLGMFIPIGRVSRIVETLAPGVVSGIAPALQSIIKSMVTGAGYGMMRKPEEGKSRIQSANDDMLTFAAITGVAEAIGGAVNAIVNRKYNAYQSMRQDVISALKQKGVAEEHASNVADLMINSKVESMGGWEKVTPSDFKQYLQKEKTTEPIAPPKEVKNLQEESPAQGMPTTTPEPPINESDLPSTTLTSAIATKTQGNSAFYVPNMGMVAGDTMMAQTTKSLSDSLNLTPQGISDSLSNSGKVYQDMLGQGADPQTAQIEANKAFWKGIPIMRSLSMILPDAPQELLSEYEKLLKNGDIEASHDVLNIIADSQPNLKAIAQPLQEAQATPQVQSEMPAAESTPPVLPPQEAAAVQSEVRFNPDDKIIVHSPHSGNDFEASFRGYVNDQEAVIWTGKTQMQIPVEWIVKKVEAVQGMIRIYRGEGKTPGGNWFTTDRSVAEWHKDKKGGTISYIDITPEEYKELESDGLKSTPPTFQVGPEMLSRVKTEAVQGNEPKTLEDYQQLRRKEIEALKKAVFPFQAKFGNKEDITVLGFLDQFEPYKSENAGKEIDPKQLLVQFNDDGREGIVFSSETYVGGKPLITKTPKHLRKKSQFEKLIEKNDLPSKRSTEEIQVSIGRLKAKYNSGKITKEQLIEELKQAKQDLLDIQGKPEVTASQPTSEELKLIKEKIEKADTRRSMSRKGVGFSDNNPEADWLSRAGTSKKEAGLVIAKLEAGGKLTAKQQGIVDSLVELAKDEKIRIDNELKLRQETENNLEENDALEYIPIGEVYSNMFPSAERSGDIYPEYLDTINIAKFITSDYFKLKELQEKHGKGDVSDEDVKLAKEKMEKLITTGDLKILSKLAFRDATRSDGIKLSDAGIVFIDIDNLKGMNTKFKNIQKWATLLIESSMAIAREHGLIPTRLLADEFGFIIPKGADPYDILDKVHRWMDEVSQLEIMTPSGIYHKGITFSGGFGIGTHEANSVAAQAKADGKQNVRLDKNFIRDYNKLEGTNYGENNETIIRRVGEQPPPIQQGENRNYISEGEGTKSVSGQPSEHLRKGQEQFLVPDIPKPKAPTGPIESKTSQVETDKLLDEFKSDNQPGLFEKKSYGSSSSGAASKLPPGQTIESITEQKPKTIEMPELVQLSKELLGRFPDVRKNLKNKLGYFRSGSLPEMARIRLTSQIFKDSHLTSQVLAHEVGHLIDWLPDYTLKRGNILGRLKSLTEFLKSTIGGLPTEGNELFESKDDFLSQKERTRIRLQLIKSELDARGGSLKHYIKDKQLRAEINTAIKDKYKIEIQKEMESRGLVSREQVTEELKRVTQVWNPFDPIVDDAYTEYRYSSKELYAEALSMLINDPERLTELAPKFNKVFWLNIDAKPDVRDALFKLKETLALPESARLKIRQENVRGMFQKSEELYKQKHLEMQNKTKRSIKDTIAEGLYDKNWELIKRFNEEVNAGKKINPDDNPLLFLEEENYVGGLQANYLESINTEVIQPLADQGITQADISEYLMHRMIVDAKEISPTDIEGFYEESPRKIARPLGFDQKTSQKSLDYLRDQLGTEKWRALEDTLKKFYKLNSDVMEKSYKSGLLTEEQMLTVRSNPYYVTTQVLDYLDTYVTPTFMRQVGTLKEAADFLTSTTLKMLSVIKAAEKNMTRQKIAAFLGDRNELLDAKRKWTGPLRRVEFEEKEGYGLLQYKSGGKWVGKHIDPYIADSLTYQPDQAIKSIMAIFRLSNSKWFRPVFTTFNLGFQSFNFIRDFQQAALANPHKELLLAMLDTAKNYARALPSAIRYISGARDEVLREMRANKSLSLTYNDLINVEDLNDFTEMKYLQAKYGVGIVDKNDPVKFAFLKRIFGLIEKMGNLLEVTPKIAGHLTESEIPGQNKKEMAHNIRSYWGSPDFRQFGKWKEVYNNFFMFSNAIKQGYRRSVEMGFRNPKTKSGYWFKSIELSLFPAIATALAAYGMFGDDLKKMFNKATEYDLTNYIIIPLGIDKKGNGIYARIPLEESQRLLHGIMWKILTNRNQGVGKKLSDVISLWGGNVPTLSPVADLIAAVAMYVSGRSPFDFFRGREALTEKEQAILKARGVFATKPLKAMGRYVGEKLGAPRSITGYSQYKQFQDQLSTPEKLIQNMPILGRFIKITKYGEQEQGKYRKLLNQARKYEAQPDGYRAPRRSGKDILMEKLKLQ